MIVVISLSLIIPFLMILSAQKRNYEAELEQIQEGMDFISKLIEEGIERTRTEIESVKRENSELRTKLETEELKVMRSCRNWSKMTQVKCAINPAGSCLECRDYEVLGK
jgi:competence protein ComGF